MNDVSYDLISRSLSDLTNELASASGNARKLLIKKTESLVGIEERYDKLCREFNRIMSPDNSVEIVVTQGALNTGYLNLAEAVNAGLVSRGDTIHLVFPDSDIPECDSPVLPNAHLQDRSIVRRLYKSMGAVEGTVFKLTKTGENTISVTLSEKKSARKGKKKGPNVLFSDRGLHRGDILTYDEDPTITCKIVDERHVIYNGEIYFLSGLYRHLTGIKQPQHVSMHFRHNGRLLSDMEG